MYKITSNAVIFNEYFNEPVDELVKYLTESITIIDLSASDKFNHSLDGIECQMQKQGIICNIKQIRLGMSFRQELDELPSTLEVLDMSMNSKFNKSLDNLPSSLLVLKTSEFFEQPVDNLPNNLKILDLNSSLYFSHNLDNLPNSITVLKLKGKFNNRLDNLPSSLKTLELNESFSHSFSNLPNSIKHLTISCPANKKIDSLPRDLEILTLQFNDCNLDINIIPKSLERIILVESNILNKYELEEKFPTINIEDAKL